MTLEQHDLVKSSLTSSSSSMVCRKPISMRYNDYIGDCCRSLAKCGNASADVDLVHFINLQRLTEEIASAFGHDSINSEGGCLRMDNVELSVRAFKSRLHDLRHCLPSKSTFLRK